MQTFTNARGVFEVPNVPPGEYLVFASRGGYLPLQYGQRYQNHQPLQNTHTGADEMVG